MARMESVGPHSKAHLKGWWQPILQMRLDDPQQEAPFWLGTNNVVLNTPFPGIQIKAYAVVGTSQAGVFLSGPRRANLFAIQKQLKQERASLWKELPKGTEIEAGHYYPIRFNRSSFKSHHDRQRWIMSTMNAFAKVLRPRLRRWYEQTRR